MDPSRLMTQTATLHHVTETGVDVYNDPTTTETTSTVGCLLQQRTRIEQTAGGQISTETLVLFLPAGTTVDALAYVTVDGLDYQLDGPPWPAFNPRSQAVSHIEAQVKRVE
jgi:hypothetical protein